MRKNRKEIYIMINAIGPSKTPDQTSNRTASKNNVRTNYVLPAVLTCLLLVPGITGCSNNNTDTFEREQTKFGQQEPVDYGPDEEMALW